jgi:hypothetical protein
MVKSKSKYVKEWMKLNPNDKLDIDIILKYYEMENNKGYYISEFNFKQEEI